MTDLPKLIVGNWKMHGTAASLDELRAVAEGCSGLAAEVAICPPFTLVARAAMAAQGSRLAIGAQDVHPAAGGAHTGDVAAAMLVDAGATMVIVGHSERRADHGETGAQVRAKARAATSAGLAVIVCVGETEAERDDGRAEAVVGGQLAGSLPDGAAALTVAYEPVWAIGTGRTPSLDDVATMHGFIRGVLNERYGADAPVVRILYGGSVKPENAAALLGVPEVGGALVGGASLSAGSLLAIAAAG